ncbi:uncharacterized protein PRCAT00003478001 [Priceomyces carsonii]|uniref:uncharacterized protein n=1 Tax=Priceomyces carsonii TaxID=28549 RepID=UPI002ED8E02D|nr:unnamed protein product [Priceomyces carsonii]
MGYNAPLPKSAGYAVVVGLGFLFALGMVSITGILRRYRKEILTSEEFSTAGRSIKVGLISASIVSSWTWAATLLTSTTQTYSNGISGGFFYAAGATCQIILFACLAIKAKEKAPNAHTYLEIIKTRYGKTCHIVYIFFGLATNILVTAMLLCGTSATIQDMCGDIRIEAVILLLPLPIVVYTILGGLKATFLTDYVHTIILIAIIMVFSFTAFAKSSLSGIGSAGALWEVITELGRTNHIEGNADGSYLTLHSKGGGIFFVINIVGGFGTVFLDNGYFNKAFASSPSAALPGYVLGGLAWFAIPVLTATTMGLSALALENTPAWPTYPEKLTPEQVSAGLVLPNAATALLGKGGATAALIMVFMACTSAMSAELIAVSTVFSYDIFRTYINPRASGRRIMFVSHCTVLAFAYIMAGFAIGLYHAGISMGYLYELMGIVIGGGVFPSALTLLSKQQNNAAAIGAPLLSLGLAVMSWLLVAKFKFGSINMQTTFEDDAMLTGNVVALLSPLVFVPLLTTIFRPQNFDFSNLKRISRVDEEEEILQAVASQADVEELGDKPYRIRSKVSQIAEEIIEESLTDNNEELALLTHSFKKSAIICTVLTLSIVILWPMPLYGSKYVFSKKFFTGWITVLFIWIFYTAIVVILYPLWESRKSIIISIKGIYWDLKGQSWKVREWQNQNPEELHVVQSQIAAQLSKNIAE